jgi:hypothetical protein
MRPGALSWPRARAVAGRARPLPPVKVPLEQGIAAHASYLLAGGDILVPLPDCLSS